MGRHSVTSATFYCLNCGQRNIPIFRSTAHQRTNNHRKKLYCPHCQLTVNHIEIKDYLAKTEFLHHFKNGDYKEEAQQSIEYINKEESIWNKI
jgi:hypothetical protein